MGGSGSSRWIGYRRHQTVADAALCLPMSSLNDMVTRAAACEGWLRWITSEGVPRASLGVALGAREPGGRWMTLSYSVSVANESPRKEEYTVRLDATPQRFGGVRWWLVCPGCWVKRSALYLPTGRSLRFRCRLCHHLKYPTQRLDRFARAARREYLCARKMGMASADWESCEDSPPPRQFGRHRCRYERQVEAWARAHFRREVLEDLRMVRGLANLPWLFRNDPRRMAEARELAKCDFGWDVGFCADADDYVREVLESLPDSDRQCQ